MLPCLTLAIVVKETTSEPGGKRVGMSRSDAASGSNPPDADNSPRTQAFQRAVKNVQWASALGGEKPEETSRRVMSLTDRYQDQMLGSSPTLLMQAAARMGAGSPSCDNAGEPTLQPMFNGQPISFERYN